MPRNRVLSFMSQWTQDNKQPRSPTTDEKEPARLQKSTPPPSNENENPAKRQPLNIDTANTEATRSRVDGFGQQPPRSPGTPSRARGDSRFGSRPVSMIQTYNPPQMEVAQDTPPELAPIFSYLNSHSNKLYQEGYFLKLHDLDTRGKPSQDRVWNECFAQLVGTVLSLWDAAALDTAGEDGEVVPTFINLSDASIKMIESLPMNGAQGGSLQNVLSVSTAANNRYLLHFNSLNSLTQWTAGIRLAMFEHSALQEAYTGSLIAGKGKYLNNIRQIMERSRFVYDDWARVRFGAGTPWRRCWCVISPPDEKEFAKSQKTLKKSSAYGRVQLPKGDIKFYDTRKITKKTKPIATINDAYAAYAIYPQSKPLIDQSTLVKLEGLVTIHGSPETTTEGFVFVMPEVHAAVSGFEMMLRWLFPVYDTFCLYGRPARLIADTLDQRGLMFAMPSNRRYGHLDILDVSGLIHTDGSQHWSERQWRKELRKLTSNRMTAQVEDRTSPNRAIGGRRNTTSRQSLPPTRTGGVQFHEPATHSTPGSRSSSPSKAGADVIQPPKRVGTAPPAAFNGSPHKRSASDAHGYRKYMAETPSRLSYEQGRDGDEPPAPPRHGGALGAALESERDHANSPYEQVVAQQAASPFMPPPEPVVTPPALQHNPHSRPLTQPHVAPELLRKHSNVDAATLYQMQEAARPHEAEDGVYPVVQDYDPSRMQHDALPYRNQLGVPANQSQGFVGYANEYGSSSQRDLRQGLSTIPGSPNAGNDGDNYMDAREQPSIDGLAAASNNDRADSPSLKSRESVVRKPVPKQLPQVPTEDTDASRGGKSQVRDMDSPASPASSAGVYSDDAVGFVDEDALERILNDNSDHTNSFVSEQAPEYASTASRSSLDAPQQNKQKEYVRAGKLKTVGDPTMTAPDPRGYGRGNLGTRDKAQQEHAAAVPTVDFGPTYSNRRPGTSGAITPGDMERRSRSRSADRPRQRSGSRLSGYFDVPAGISPYESKSGHRQSYLAAKASTPTGLESMEAEDPRVSRHSMAWAPIAASPGSAQQMRQTLTPEQWVQYRAELAQQQPQYAIPRKSRIPPFAHQRHASTSNLPQQRQTMTKTPPPFARAISGDWTGQRQLPLNRPHSRGASLFLELDGGLVNNPNSLTLSAREQMHIARATGTPLLDLTVDPRDKNRIKVDDNNPGLVGALAAREREQAALKQGIRSGMLRQAILARQQEQIRLEQEAQMRAQMQMQQQQAMQAAQAAQYQQMAYQRVAMAQQQQQPHTLHQQQPVYQRQNMPPQMQHRQSWGPQRQQQPQAGGFGGQYVQQQGAGPRAYGGQYEYMQGQQQPVSGQQRTARR
ncbi:hypothetical protein AC579_2669 [Pseudocercospora musae]|uniref:PH domain-containing protein n=1 Tax=Pseudocercospora musae TaxID=113226 RepID=A0A139IV84_9PEZI|nr:hypothetical protein AC579_2669 [Pseudocercospora musae]